MREGGREGDIYLSNFVLLSSDSSDYVRKYQETLTFNACQREACFDVRIYDDVRVENSESFNFTVEMSSGLGSECPIQPIRGTVIIHDNDGMTVDKMVYNNSVVLTLMPVQER